MEDVERTKVQIGMEFRLKAGTPEDVRTVAGLHADPVDGHVWGVSDTVGVFHYLSEIEEA